MMDGKEGVINSTWKQGRGQERLEGRDHPQADSLYGLKVGWGHRDERERPSRQRETGWGDREGSKDHKVDKVN